MQEFLTIGEVALLFSPNRAHRSPLSVSKAGVCRADNVTISAVFSFTMEILWVCDVAFKSADLKGWSGVRRFVKFARQYETCLTPLGRPAICGTGNFLIR
jgi:hypothetical protein